MNENAEAFISLVRLGIGHPSGPLPEDIEWDSIESLSVRHGLSAIVVDGIEKIILPLWR